MRRNFANWLEAYADWADCTEAPRQFHYWAGVCVLSAVLRQSVWHGNLFPNFYLMLVGPGESAVYTAKKMLEKLQDIKFVRTPMSTATFFKDLLRAEREEELNSGEFEHQANAVITGDMRDVDTSNAPIACYVLRRLWDGGRIMEVDKEEMAHRAPDKPLTTLLTYAAPHWCRTDMSNVLGKSGLLSRISVVYGEPCPPPLRKRDHAMTEQKLLDDLFSMQELYGELKLGTPEALAEQDAAFAAHLASCPHHNVKRDLPGLHRKLSMIRQAACGTKAVPNLIDLAAEDVMLLEYYRKQAFRFVGWGPRAKTISTIIDAVARVKEIPAAQLADALFVEHAGAGKFTRYLMDCMDAGVLVGEVRENKVWVRSGGLSRFPSPY